MKTARLPMAVGLAALALCAFAAEGGWLKRVPAAARARQNPFASDPEAAGAGRKLFAEHCASCHGQNAEGTRRKPTLRSQRVHDASDGELEWLLTNGSLARGMPSWSGLPEEQRWQIVVYLRSLPPLPPPAVSSSNGSSPAR